jgi:hypothetical protein
MSTRWSLDPKEVGVRASGSASSESGQFSRRLQRRSYRMTLSHAPTGIQVQGEIPDGRYSKKEMQKLRKDLHERLFLVLESKVAKHLRVSGR